jgi:transposase InsO family protein
MFGKGNYNDNAAVKTFIISLIVGLIWWEKYKIRYRKKALFRNIIRFYNPRRRHSYLCNIGPVKHKRMAC